MKISPFLATLIVLLFPFSAWASPSAISITVQPGARQTFRGLGASVFPWTPSVVYNAQVTPAQTQQMAHLLWHDARLRSVRLWIHPGQEPIDYYIDGYVRTHKLPEAIAAGAKDLILAPDYIPKAMNDGHGYIREAFIPEYAALLAGFIREFRDKTGILINNCGVLNEPNDRPVKFSDAQWPVMVKALRQALNAHGLQTVKIVAPESANCGTDAYAIGDSFKADPEAWQDLAGVATHSYNNAATEDMAGRVVDKEYWITEAGGMTDTDETAGAAMQAASVASRFLNDVNHRVTHWQFFIGAEQTDPRGNTGRILKYDVSPFRLTILQKYYSLKQLSDTFDVGASFRHSLSSLDGEMTYTYSHAPEHKPHLNAAVAQNPDGTWGIGLSNFTSDTFAAPSTPAWVREQGGYPAQTFTIAIRVPELALIKTLLFAVRRSNAGANDVPVGMLVMHQGRLTVPNIGPLDVITLRSMKVKN